eukprot:scaffold81484_cov31-Tisochrysis_lutea.AAC.5
MVGWCCACSRDAAGNRGVRAKQRTPRASSPPAPQSQKNLDRREYETTCPAWHTRMQTEQHPSDCVSPQV